MKQNFFIAALITCIIILFVIINQPKQDSTKQQFSTNKFSSDLVDIRAPILTGGEQSLTNWKGKIIVLNFWATWCPPCIREIPIFIKKQKEWQDKNVQFIGFSIDNIESVTNFAKQYNLNYPNMLGDKNNLMITESMGNEHLILPFTIIINQDFKIVAQFSGAVSEIKLTEAVTALF